MKNLLQIPRNINAKFCCLNSGPSENYENNSLDKIESKKIKILPINREQWKLKERNSSINNKKIELAELKENLELKELLAENNIDAKIDTPPGLTEELNHSPAASLDLNTEEFDYNLALQETNNLLAQLDNDIVKRGFGPMNG